MYPETDVPVYPLDSKRWQETLETLPMTDDERQQRISEYEVSNDQASQLLARELDDVFVQYAAQLPHKGWASVVLENDTANPELCANVMAVKEAGLVTRESMNEIIEANLRMHCSPCYNTSRITLCPENKCMIDLSPDKILEYILK